MPVETRVIFICDQGGVGCRIKSTQYAPSIRASHRRVRQNGWMVSKDGAVSCPACAPKRREEIKNKQRRF